MPLITDERSYLSRYAPVTVEISVRVGATLTDPDDEAVTVTMIDLADQPVFEDRVAVRDSEGVYTLSLTSDDLSVPGLYDLVCSYEIDTTPAFQVIPISVGEVAPQYDALSDDMKALVERTYARFGDLFDSAMGGPHLQMYAQAHFGRNRAAQALATAIGKLNVMAQPHQGYDVDSFPVDTWGGIAEQMLFVQIIEHLRLSYTEQPRDSGVTVVYADRRDYMDRWGIVLKDAKDELKPMVQVFKVNHMGLSTGARLLVSGGVFGRAPGRRPPTNAARPRFSWRFY